MSKLRWAGLPFAGAVTFAVTWAALVSQGMVPVWNGALPQAHLISAVLDGLIRHWHMLPSSIHSLNVVCATAFLGLLSVVALRASTIPAAVIAVLVSITVAASPFALVLWADSAGAAMAITVALFCFIAADAIGFIRLPAAARITLICATAFQDYLFAPALLIYALNQNTDIKRRTLLALLSILTATLAYVIDAQVLHHALHAGGHATARSAVFAAISLFLLAPIIAYLNNLGTLERIGWRPAGLTTPILMAIALAAVSPFSRSDDPSSYWLAAEILIVLSLLARVGTAQASRWIFASLLVGTALVQGYVSHQDTNISPTAHAARELWTLAKILKANRNEDLCVYGNRTQVNDLRGSLNRSLDGHISDRLIITSDVNDCLSRHSETRLATLESGKLTDFGQSGIALALAADHEAGAHALPLFSRPFVVFPKRRTHLPGGRGAFKDTLQTPLGNTYYFTIAAPFVVTFPCLKWKAGDRLSFAAGNPLGLDPHAGSVRLAIRLADSQTDPVIIIPPTRTQKSVSWRYHTITLLRTAKCANLAMDVKPAGKNGVATWAGVVNPTILSAEK